METAGMRFVANENGRLDFFWPMNLLFFWEAFSTNCFEMIAKKVRGEIEKFDDRKK